MSNRPAMNVETRWAVDPKTARAMDTAALRSAFLVDNLFTPGRINLTYSHLDRLAVGGAVPVAEPLVLESFRTLGTQGFMDRREAVIANIGGQGTVRVGDSTYTLDQGDMLYIGKQAGEVSFSGHGARFYIVSAPAHQRHETTLIKIEEATRIDLGAKETSNERSIFQFVHAEGVKSCQLVVGMTKLAPGSVWNTMPAHVHDRRSEAYLYFGMAETTRVVHLMGEPSETRHLIVANEQALLSPGWSIHSGAGTANYTFIWAMAGENIDYRDVDPVAMEDLR
ncbi:5-dehydro-4-deoxy-D-glucuronate isomerase [Pelagibacterium limicola]|uniref:5-dehydro-4-deoxy-D-glucuronate isomerase n=1 Tax=Pelagibacterium limicola TaxID=2791022 RepID=UPI001FE60190|nr:5-dehydro-4-deoxy-D-glucuronate isomerase [Pelagibacterium limicola]